MAALLTGAAGSGLLLLHGDRLALVTNLSTLLFFAAIVMHAIAWRGAGWTAAFLWIMIPGSLLAESLGIRTGVPFGAYHYGPYLGFEVIGVPAIVPLAWTMMSYPALVIGRQISRRPEVAAIVSAAALTSWDFVVDPVMVASGAWHWDARATVWLGIPVTNFVGWFGVSCAQMLAAAQLPTPSEQAVDDRIPRALYAGGFAIYCARALMLGRGLAAASGLAALTMVIGAVAFISLQRSRDATGDVAPIAASFAAYLATIRSRWVQSASRAQTAYPD